ncbi:MAG: hypothetical protein ACI8RD_000543, partial [Bacillariaceae sp.]
MHGGSSEREIYCDQRSIIITTLIKKVSSSFLKTIL